MRSSRNLLVGVLILIGTIASLRGVFSAEEKPPSKAIAAGLLPGFLNKLAVNQKVSFELGNGHVGIHEYAPGTTTISATELYVVKQIEPDYMSCQVESAATGITSEMRIPIDRITYIEHHRKKP